MKLWRSTALVIALAVGTGGANAQPAAAPFPAPIAEPLDVDYPGAIELDVDASDVVRGIFRVRERLLVAAAGPLTLLYPEWHPGKHDARGAIHLLAGLEVRANGELVQWRRDPVNVYAFHVNVPAGASSLDLSFQFVSPTQTNQGRIVATREMLNLAVGGRAALSGRPLRLPHSRRAELAVAGRLGVCRGARRRKHARAVDTVCGDDARNARRFAAVRRPARPQGRARSGRIPAGAPEPVRRSPRPARGERPSRLAPHRNLVQQAYRLFGSQHYDHYDFLFALTDRMGGIGLEHHRSSENGVAGGYFTDWDRASSDRDLLAA